MTPLIPTSTTSFSSLFYGSPHDLHLLLPDNKKEAAVYGIACAVGFFSKNLFKVAQMGFLGYKFLTSDFTTAMRTPDLKPNQKIFTKAYDHPDIKKFLKSHASMIKKLDTDPNFRGFYFIRHHGQLIPIYCKTFESQGKTDRAYYSLSHRKLRELG